MKIGVKRVRKFSHLPHYVDEVLRRSSAPVNGLAEISESDWKTLSAIRYSLAAPCANCGGAHVWKDCPTLDDERAILAEIDKSPDGIGDTLKALFEKIGADKAAKLFQKITGVSCGCEARRKWMNRWWPYRK